MAIILDWKIRTTTARCEHTDEPFQDEQDFYTCIFDDPESDGFIRKDYSVAAWEEIRKSIDPAPFSFWRSTYHAPVATVKEEALRDTSAEGMLRRMAEEDEPHTENARFILALMLERKKTLIPTDVKDAETRKLLFYEHKDTGDVFIVADPGLHLSEIEAVQREVTELLAREESGQAHPVEENTESAETTEDDETPEATESDEASSDAEGPGEEESAEQAEQTEEESGETQPAEDEAVPGSDEELSETV